MSLLEKEIPYNANCSRWKTFADKPLIAKVFQ